MTLKNTREYDKFVFDQFGNTAVMIVDPAASAGTQKEYLSRLLDTTGDGSGTKVATGNYSDGGSGLTVFKIAPGAGEIFRIARLITHYADEGPVNNGSVYGTNITLTNGIVVTLTDAHGTDVSLTNSLPIKTNNDWGRWAYDITITSFVTGTNYYQSR